VQVPLYHHVKGHNLKELNTSSSRFTQFPFARFCFNVTWKIYIPFWICVINFSLMWFGIDDPWWHLSYIGG